MNSDENGSRGNQDGGVQRGPSFVDPTQPRQHLPAEPGTGPEAGPEVDPSRQTAREPGWDAAPGDVARPSTSQPYTDPMTGEALTVAQLAGLGDGQDPAAQHPQSTQAYAPQDPYAQPNPYAQQDPYGQPNPYGQPGLYGEPNPYGQPTPYQQPYGPYSPYGTYAYASPGKSKASAALLAFFLGGFGAHNFYLDQKNLGLAHLGLIAGSFVISILSSVMLSTVSASDEGGWAVLVLLGSLMWAGNGIWAFVEFIMILLKPEHELGR